MAVSAFKSNSKRGTMASSSSSKSKEIKEKSAAPRRSRSVSVAVSHYHEEFLNKRDNPLFCTTTSPPHNIEIQPEKTDKAVEFRSNDGEIRRGRSISRNDGVAVKNLSGIRSGIGRSSSRVDIGRRGRSVSVRPVSRQYSESEAEKECDSSSNLRRSIISGRNVDMLSESSSSASCFHITDWEHGSAVSWSEAEEKTSNADIEQIPGRQVGDGMTPTGIYETVRSEVRRAISDIQSDLQTAIRRNITTSTGNSGGVDALADSVNQGADDLVLDIRREYAIELEQSHERATKLREDLAIEEQRGIELSRILKELLPELKPSNSQRSHQGRKGSIERRKMSKSLAEEAMTYFDECVSISTLDSSDLSSQEDPPVNIFGTTALVGNRASNPQGRLTASTTDIPAVGQKFKLQESGIQGEPLHLLEDYHLTDTSSNNKHKPALDEVNPDAFQFSFAEKPTYTFGVQRVDIKDYVKRFEKDIEKDANESDIKTSKPDDLNIETFLLDRALFKKRISSGSILLCGMSGFSM